MKILMSNYEFPPIGGGAGRANLNLLNQFAGNEHLDIDMLTSSTEPGYTIQKFASNIKIHRVGVRKKNLHYWRQSEVIEWLFKASQRYRRLVIQNDYDLAHAFFAFPTGWLCWRHAAKMPYILSLRGSDVPGYNQRLGIEYKLLSSLFRKIWKSASAIVANSEGLGQLASKFTPDIGIGVIPNGVDTDTFAPSPDNKPASPARLLTVCRLIGRKRIDLLIRALAALKDAGVEAELNIAGEGNLMVELEQLAVELLITDRVNFLGLVTAEHIPQLYRNNDIFVMSSEHEGMSNAMLEAMASGLPVVTTKCEGVEELITDNGIALDSADPQAIAEAVGRLVDNHAEYEQMAAAARRRAEQFNWARTAEKYIECYRSVMAAS